MHLPQRWLKERGASVLAALVLVALLGAVLIVLQYARSSGDFAYDSAALTAATAAAAAPAVKNADGSACNPATQACPCNQTAANSAGADNSKDSIEQCLPGCVYTIIPGDPAKIQSASSPASSNPSASGGTINVCTNFNGDTCSTVTCTKGASLSQSAALLTASAIQLAPNSTIGTQLTSTFINNSTAGSPASAALNTALTSENTALAVSQVNTEVANEPATEAGITLPASDSQAQQQQNVDQALQQLQNPCSASGNCASVSDQESSPYSTGVSTNPDTTTDTLGITCNGDPATNGTCTNASGQTVSSPQPSTDVPTPPPRPDNLGSASTFSDPNNVAGAGASPDNPSIPASQVCVVPGQVSVNGNCTTPAPGPPAPPAPPANPAPAAPAAPNTGTVNNYYYGTNGLGAANNSPAGIATSFLTGLVQGITAGLMQQNALAAQQAATQASAPYGVGTDGLSCPQPQAQPDPSQCTVGAWQQIYQSNQCPTSWQCVPSSSGTPALPATQPTATLSCEPQVADVGMSVSISFSCGNATDSAGSGFDTKDNLSGSRTKTVAAPPAGDNTVSYGLTCINQNLTAGAQCSVEINQPSIVLIANPSSVPSGASTAIGWVTSGMQSCTVSSPDTPAFTAANAGNTSVNGVATTPALTAPMTVDLDCQTLGGGTDDATTQVTVGGVAGTNTTSTVTASSTADGGTIAHGGSVTITWSSVSPPSGSAAALFLVNNQTGQASDVIAGDLAPSGTYTWSVPSVGATCNPNASNVCDTDLVQGDSYAIEAVLYTPSSAYVGDGTAPANPVAPSYGNSAVTGTFTVDDTSQVGGE